MSVEKSQKKELLQAYKGRRRVGCVYGLRHRPTGRMLVQHERRCAERPERGAVFLQSTNTCPRPCLRALWRAEGPQAFELVVLEELERGEEQEERAFREDLKTLEALWKEKLQGQVL